MCPRAHEHMRPPQLAFYISYCRGRMAFMIMLLLLIQMSSTAQTTTYNADSIMLRVFSFVQREELNKADFASEVYTQHYLRTHRKGAFARYIPGMLRMEKGSNEYFGENLAYYHYHTLGNIDKKNIASYSTMPYLHTPRDRWVGQYSFSIYNTNFFSNNILSPFNHRNKRFYRYQFNYSYTNSGRIIANLSVEPRVWNMQLVRGNADIDVQSGEVKLFSFFFNHGWASLHFSAEMGDKGQARLLPRNISLHSQIKFLGNRLNEQFNVYINYEPLTTQLHTNTDTLLSNKFDLTNICLLRNDTTGTIRKKSYFDTHRPIRLLPEQQAIYETDSLEEKAKQQLITEDDTYTNLSNKRLKETTDIIFDSHTVKIGENGKVKFPPILTPSMLEWSRSKGFSLQTRLQLKWQPGRYNSLTFSPRVGYNFKQKQVYWRLPLAINILPALNGRISINAAGGDHIYNSQQLEGVKKIFETIPNSDTILYDLQLHKFNYYRDNRVVANFSFSLIAGFTIRTGLRYNHRTLIHWNNFAKAIGMRKKLTNLAPQLNLVWTPAQYFYRDGKRCILLKSKWPTFMLDYERSISQIDEHTSYERIEFDTKYHLPLHALRSFYFRIGAGGYLHRSHNCFLNYNYFRNSYLPAGVSDEMSGQFQLLDERWYNESDYYVRFSTAFESPMLLLSHIKWLTRFISRERIYCNLLNVRSMPIYTEFGYGLSLPLINIGGFFSVASNKQVAAGCNIVFHWGD